MLTVLDLTTVLYFLGQESNISLNEDNIMNSLAFEDLAQLSLEPVSKVRCELGII